MNRKSGGKLENSVDFDSEPVDSNASFQAMKVLISDLKKNVSSDASFKAMKLLFNDLKERFNLSSKELLCCIDEKGMLIPDCVFVRELSVFQSIVKFLRENQGMKNREIATVTNSSQKSVWQAYDQSRNKMPSKFIEISSEYPIPLSAINPHLTILESVVLHLKEVDVLSFHKISVILKRDDRTIWTIYSRAKKKLNEKKK